MANRDPARATRAPKRRVVSLSAAATEALAEDLGRRAHGGLVLALDGDLGAGKTTFVRGLARGLDADPAEVTSPTYTLLHEVSGRLALQHFDAWMRGRGAAFLEDGGAEWLATDGVAAIEWAVHVEAYLPADRLDVRLSHRAPEERMLELVARGEDPRVQQLLAALDLPEGIVELGEGA